jgi:hypothetical protein
MPASVECRELEPSTYALRMPGETERARITTSPAIFDEHFESHQLLLPDSPLFQGILKAAEVADEEQSAEAISALRDLLK